MTPERWGRVETLFQRALGLSEHEQPGFLAEACGEDRGLRQEVESLLAAHHGAEEGFLASSDGLRMAQLDLPESPPERIGSWKVVSEIGRGGMGVVYEARRDDGQFEQPAALKLIQRGSNSRQLRERFLRERQILARMEHPGIARLLDGGVTADGRPWFALERIEGVSIVEHCERNDLGLRERLRLFNQVCAAVEYAHRNLVVHRDLKPSNVMVDGEGRVKLLDFGIAKMLRSGPSDAPLTSIMGRPMTPGYGAPELVFGGPITTASDVYSLGVILYELLSGRPLFHADDEQAALPAPFAAEPAVLSRLAAQSAQPTSFYRQLDGDLDTIAAKTIQLDPAQRYASAEALREDIERYLRGDPVRAYPDSFTYRAKKLLRRHRVAVAASLLVVGSLSLGLGVALWQAGVAAEQRDIAQERSEQTDQVRQFVVDLFRASDPRDRGGVELTAHQLLERGIERVQARALDDRPDLQVELLTTIGHVSISLGDFPQAASLFEQALALEPGPEPRNRLRTAAALNGLGETSAHVGDLEAAARHHRQALALRLEFAGVEDQRTAQSYNNLGVALAGLRRLPEAIEAYGKALEIQEKLPDVERIDLLDTMGNLAVSHRLSGNYPEARRLLRDVIAKMRGHGAEKHSHMVNYLGQLGSVERRLGHYPSADRLFRESYELSKELWGESHPDTLISMNNYAVGAFMLGREAEAEPLMRKLLDVDLQEFGSEHAYVAQDRDNLGRVLIELGRVEEGLELIGMACDFYRSERASPRALALHKVRHAWVHLAVDHPDRAHALAEQALDAERRREPQSLEHLAGALVASAFAGSAVGRLEDAESLFREALAVHEQRQTSEHPDAGIARFGLGRLLLSQGRLVEAREQLDRADKIWQASLPEAHWRRAELLVALGDLTRREGRPEAGRRLMESGIDQLRQGRGSQHWRTRAAARQLDPGLHHSEPPADPSTYL